MILLIERIQAIPPSRFEVHLDIKVWIGVFLIHPPTLFHDALDSSFALLFGLLVGLPRILTFDRAPPYTRRFGARIRIVRQNSVDLTGTLGTELIPEFPHDLLGVLLHSSRSTIRAR